MKKREIDKQILKWEEKLSTITQRENKAWDENRQEDAFSYQCMIGEIKQFLVSLYDIKRIDFED